jgi:hypothetical protein
LVRLFISVALAALAALGGIPEALARGDHIEVDLDSTASGGDGVAGQVIGAFTAGPSVVNAVNIADHTSGVGGDAGTTSSILLVNTGESPSGPSAESVGGDGVATQVVGAARPVVADASVSDPPLDGQALPLSFELAS